MSDESRKGKPRVVEPQRRQGVIRFEMPEDKLPPTHAARVLWDVIGALDLTAFLDGVKAIEGTVGRQTLSPRMKLTLWLYAISNGVGSAREIARLVAWRERMTTDEAKAVYRARASLCELINAHLRSHHGVEQFLVRGLAQVTCVARLAAIASNVLQHASTLLG